MSATDFLNAYRSSGLLSDPNKEDKIDLVLPLVLVSPLGTSVPNDGLLEYATFDSAKDFLGLAEHTRARIVLAREDQSDLLRVLCDNSELLDIEIKAVYGVPECDYRPWFDEVTFHKERLSYSPFVSEMRIAKDVAEMQEKERPKTVVEKEESTFIRKKGGVKLIEPDRVTVGLGSDNDDIGTSGTEFDA